MDSTELSKISYTVFQSYSVSSFTGKEHFVLLLWLHFGSLQPQAPALSGVQSTLRQNHYDSICFQCDRVLWNCCWFCGSKEDSSPKYFNFYISVLSFCSLAKCSSSRCCFARPSWMRVCFAALPSTESCENGLKSVVNRWQGYQQHARRVHIHFI